MSVVEPGMWVGYPERVGLPSIGPIPDPNSRVVGVVAFIGWFRSLLGRGRPPDDLGLYYDVPSQRTAHIPASELQPGCVQAHVEGVDGIVWILPEQFRESEIRHPPFGDDQRPFISDIRDAFAEHRKLSYEGWEEGFRRDRDPTREIAVWCHAAHVYREFASGEPSPERRRDLYRVIVACLTTVSAESAWQVLKVTSLTRQEADEVVRRYFGGST